MLAVTPTFLLLVCNALTAVHALNVGVVQHVVVKSSSDPLDIINANLAAYDMDVTSAKNMTNNSIDLLVFPEFGLFADGWDSGCISGSSANLYCQRYPDPKASTPLCSTNDNTTAIEQLACSAIKGNMTISANLCEEVVQDDGSIYNYNTQVILDPSGSLIAKYHKTHPYFKKCFKAPDTPDYVTFDVANTTVGVFTCMDILYKEPFEGLRKKGITHFVYSAAIPIVGSEAVKLYSEIHNATIMASNLGIHESGVFSEGHKLTPEATGSEDILIAVV